jgi:hypothetical protein
MIDDCAIKCLRWNIRFIGGMVRACRLPHINEDRALDVSIDYFLILLIIRIVSRMNAGKSPG